MEISQELAELLKLYDADEDLVMYLDAAGHLNAAIDGWEELLVGDPNDPEVSEGMKESLIKKLQNGVNEAKGLNV